ncbi:MAG: hypothetical protein IKS48_04485 [Eubacterium sp.]|nr:hypothetical protein [Eubacterium sp.]
MENIKAKSVETNEEVSLNEYGPKLKEFPQKSIDYTGVPVSEYEKISEFLRTDNLIHNLSFALQEDISEDDVSFSSCYMVNFFMFPVDSYADWNAKESLKDIYGDLSLYTVPLVIKGKKTVISLKQVDGQYEFVGASYGEANSTYFIDEEEIERIISEAGISEETINYSDIMLANFAANTLFVHINTVEKDYMIPYTAIDLSEYTHEKLYKSGEIYETSEILKMLADSSFTDISNTDENGGYEADTLTATPEESIQDDKIESGSSESLEERTSYTDPVNLNNNESQSGAVNKILLTSGILVVSFLILIFIAIRIKRKKTKF